MLSLETWGCFVPVYTTEVDVQLPKWRGTVLALRMYSRTVDSAYTELDGFPPPPPPILNQMITLSEDWTMLLFFVICSYYPGSLQIHLYCKMSGFSDVSPAAKLQAAFFLAFFLPPLP